MNSTAITMHQIGKRYVLGASVRGYGTLRESAAGMAGRVISRLARRDRPRPHVDELWALRDVSFTVPDGDVVGLIGHNGAGKSTVLKILSRIIEPTTGWAEVTGRVGSLLEVGTGFHPELTGRENVFLNGAILGMRRAEVRRRFDEIVAFAEVERFLDTPVKRYSSGMAVRLAFAVAAHLEPEVLLVDEVLAVGDAAFQKRSLAKMTEVAEQGRTVIFVSHNLSVIQSLCRRGILLERGRVVADAPVRDTVGLYLRTLEASATEDLLQRTDRDGRGWDEVLVRAVELHDARDGRRDVLVAGNPTRIVVRLTAVVPSIECRLTILNSLGQPVTTFDSEASAPTDARDSDLGPQIECEVPSLPLAPGRYRIDVLLKGRQHIQDGLQAATFFDVAPGILDGRAVAASGFEGDVAIPHRWRLPV